MRDLCQIYRHIFQQAFAEYECGTVFYQIAVPPLDTARKLIACGNGIEQNGTLVIPLDTACFACAGRAEQIYYSNISIFRAITLRKISLPQNVNIFGFERKGWNIVYDFGGRQAVLDILEQLVHLRIVFLTFIWNVPKLIKAAFHFGFGFLTVRPFALLADIVAVILCASGCFFNMRSREAVLRMEKRIGDFEYIKI